MNLRLLSLLILLFASLIGCASLDDEGEYADDPGDGDTSDLCYEGEEYDAATDSCIVYEDEPADSSEQSADSGSDSAECYEHETYDAETDTCTVDISCDTDEECDAIIDRLYEGYDATGLEYWDMLEEDCLPGESYDADEAVCYIACDSNAECERKAAEIYAGLDVYFDDDFSGSAGRHDHGAVASQGDENSAESESDTEESGASQLTGEVDNALAQALQAFSVYTLNDDLSIQIISEDDEADAKYLDRNRHDEIWRFVSTLLPKSVIRSEVEQYMVFSDGPEETLAFVAQVDNNLDKWFIAMDLEDTGLTGNLNQKEIVHTVVHEFAHILTLENDQVPPDATGATESSCKNYFPGEGCATATSYINLYYQRFWVELADEHAEIDQIEDENDRLDATYAFYEKYTDRFVSDYAATNPGEDIAESFTAFVLKDKPTGDSIAEKKVQFFYNFPPLMEIRSHIRSQLARAGR